MTNLRSRTAAASAVANRSVIVTAGPGLLWTRSAMGSPYCRWMTTCWGGLLFSRGTITRWSLLPVGQFSAEGLCFEALFDRWSESLSTRLVQLSQHPLLAIDNCMVYLLHSHEMADRYGKIKWKLNWTELNSTLRKTIISLAMISQ